MDESNLRDLIEKVIKLKTAKLTLSYLGAMIHRNNELLKIPIMAMTLTSKWWTSNASGAARLSWRRLTRWSCHHH